MRKGLLALGLALLGTGAASLWAGPPYETDDPEPPALGHWEIILAGFTSAQAGGAAGGGPQLELNYGAGKDLQLSLSPQLSYDAPRSGPLNYGLGDTELGVKVRFLHETDRRPEAAFYPQVALPTGDAGRGLGNGAAQVFLPLWFQKSWGPWSSFGGGGYWIDPGAGNRNWTFLGAALQRDLGGRFSVGGELFYHSASQEPQYGIAGSDPIYLSTAQVAGGLGSNLAFLYHIDESDHILLSAGRDLVGNTAFTGYLAFEKLI
jgi:hypothetical protein